MSENKRYTWNNEDLMIDDNATGKQIEVIELTEIDVLLDGYKNYCGYKISYNKYSGGTFLGNYIYDAETNTLSFTLSKGQHHIDITLVDEAGNEWNVDRVRYLQVGNFWIYIGVVVLAVIASGAGFFIWKKKKQ